MKFTYPLLDTTKFKTTTKQLPTTIDKKLLKIKASSHLSIGHSNITSLQIAKIVPNGDIGASLQ